MMTKKHRAVVLRIIGGNQKEFYTAPGGLHKHQNWRGGYADHVHEVMSIACILYMEMKKYRRIPFTLSAALYVLFFHDFEKMFRYTVDVKGRPMKTKLAEKKVFRNVLASMKLYKISSTPEERNAFNYVHGENNDYHPTKRIMNELAAFVHCCDTLSSRVWYDYPRS